MKKIFTLSILCFFAFTMNAQKSNVDLELKLNTPVNNAYVPPMKTFMLNATITNVGNTDLKATDSLALYILYNNDSFFFPNGSAMENFKAFSGIAINANDSYVLNMPFAFDNSADGESFDFCLFVKPLNRKTNALVDSVLDDNKDCAFITVSNKTGITSQSISNSSVIAYPNPAGDHFYLLSEQAVVSAGLTDYTGKTIAIHVNDQNRIDCSGLASGIYLLTVKTADTVLTEKIIIAH